MSPSRPPSPCSPPGAPPRWWSPPPPPPPRVRVLERVGNFRGGRGARVARPAQDRMPIQVDDWAKMSTSDG